MLSLSVAGTPSSRPQGAPRSQRASLARAWFYIGDYARVKQYLREDDAVVFCDSGLKHMEALGVKPALIVGDFDSHCNPHLDVETIVLPC